MSRYNLKTGDILLLDYEGGGFFGVFTSLIKYFTHSKYSHIGLVLKDPTFIHPSLKGFYMWESSYNGTPDPQDGKIKIGVQITPLEEIINHYRNEGGQIYVRRLDTNKTIFNDEILTEIHDVVYNKPYDIVPTDWIEGLFRKDDHPQKTDRFWCSALIGYIFSKCDIIDRNIDWSQLRPSDFSYKTSIQFTDNVKYSDDERIL